MFKLPDLPYAYDALAPTVSSETMRLHHDKHQAKYVDTVNELCAKDGSSPASLEDLIVQAHAGGYNHVFNNAAQAWNHAFFWSCMTPSRTAPEGALAQAIDQAFGDQKGLRAAFVKEGEGHFGSGWVWLLHADGGLKVASTHDAANPLIEDGVVPLLVCDLWEHAYYVDYRSDRKAFLQAWFDALPDWTFAGHQLRAVADKVEAWRYPAPVTEPVRRQA